MATSSAPLYADSTQSMMAMIPADVMAEVNSIGSDSAPETATETPTEEVDDSPAFTIDEPPAVEEIPVADEESPAGEEKEEAAPPAKTDVTPEELPEGVVVGKGKDGKPGYFASESRWKSIYGNHQMTQQAANIIGEPLTIEAIQLRNDALVNQERLFDDLSSADPKIQSGVLGYMIDEMSQAFQNGEVGTDPSVPLAQAFYSTLQQKSPEAYANLRFTAAKDLVTEMYEQAAQSGSKALFSSAQHFAMALAGIPADRQTDLAYIRSATGRLGLPFFAGEEMANLGRRAADPNAQILAENARLKAQLDGRGQTNQTAQFDQFKSGVNQQIDNGLKAEVYTEALSTVAKAWEKHPEDYNRLVVEPLQREVAKVMAADPVFKDAINRLMSRAQRATNQQVRDNLAAQIRQTYVNRAKQAAEAVKRPILDFAAKTLSDKSASTNGRRAAAQTRTAVSGTPSAVQRSLVPDDVGVQFPGGQYDPKIAAQQMQKLFRR